MLALLCASGAQAHEPLLSVLNSQDLQGLTRLADEKQSDRWKINDLWHGNDSNPIIARKPHLLFAGIGQWLAGKFTGYHGIFNKAHEKSPAEATDMSHCNANRATAFGMRMDGLGSPYWRSELRGASPRGSGISSQPSLLDCDLMGRLERLSPKQSQITGTTILASKDTLRYSGGGRGFHLDSSVETSLPNRPFQDDQSRLWPADNANALIQASQARTGTGLSSRKQRISAAFVFLWLTSKSQR